MNIRKLLLGFAAFSVLLLLALTLASFFWLRGGRPVRGGEHSIPGLQEPVTVRWDRWGVPAILAGNEVDLATGLGWIHANDRFTQMELGRRAAFGRLAELLGESAVELDVYFRTLRLGRVARQMAAKASPRTRRWLSAYTAGVNAWLAERGGDLPPELRLFGARPEPWEEDHSIAFALLMARDLSFWRGHPEEERFRWLRAFGTDAVRELLQAPEIHLPEDILAMAREGAAGGGVGGGSGGDGSRTRSEESGPDLASPGSNNWALDPSRTASGKALIANDPHLGLRLPSVWYQVHLRSPGFEAAGMTLPGAPAVVIGRGTHVAWAFTHAMLDDQDLFFETLDDAGESYLRGETWKRLEAEEETVEIRGAAARRLTLRSTDLGPLLEADAERGLPARSLAWTAYAGGDPLAMLLDLPRVSTPEELLAAVRPYVCPAQNLVAAFDSGEILFTVIGGVPERRQGDGRLPSPGWDSSYGWNGTRKRATNPTVIRPPNGLLVTANHDIRPPDYALPFVAEFFPGHRAARIREVLEGSRRWDFESTGELHTDSVSLYAEEVLQALADGSVKKSFAGEAGKAWEALTSWDRGMRSRGPAALYALLERELLAVFEDEVEAAGVGRPTSFEARDLLLALLRGTVDPGWFDDVRTEAVEGRHEAVATALAAAWAAGRERWGENIARWRYDELLRFVLRHPLDEVPVLGSWMRRGPFAVEGSATTVAAFGAQWRGGHMEVTYGPSMRWVVDWGQPELVFAVLPGGQSGHPADPHYDDQIRPFLDGRLRPAGWSEARIESFTVRRMTLRP